MMEGKLASWDLCFAITKFCTCRLRPLRRHTSPASAALWGPVQPAPVQPSVSHCAAQALTARPSFPGGARTRAPSLQPSFGLQGRGPGTQRSRGMASAQCPVPQTFPTPGAEGCESGGRAGCVRCLRQAPLEVWPRDPLTTTLGQPGSLPSVAKLAPVLGKFRRAPTWLPRGERSPGPREGR